MLPPSQQTRGSSCHQTSKPSTDSSSPSPARGSPAAATSSTSPSHAKRARQAGSQPTRDPAASATSSSPGRTRHPASGTCHQRRAASPGNGRTSLYRPRIHRAARPRHQRPSLPATVGQTVRPVPQAFLPPSRPPSGTNTPASLSPIASSQDLQPPSLGPGSGAPTTGQRTPPEAQSPVRPRSPQATEPQPEPANQPTPPPPPKSAKPKPEPMQLEKAPPPRRDDPRTHSQQAQSWHARRAAERGKLRPPAKPLIEAVPHPPPAKAQPAPQARTASRSRSPPGPPQPNAPGDTPRTLQGTRSTEPSQDSRGLSGPPSPRTSSAAPAQPETADAVPATAVPVPDDTTSEPPSVTGSEPASHTRPHQPPLVESCSEVDDLAYDNARWSRSDSDGPPRDASTSPEPAEPSAPERVTVVNRYAAANAAGPTPVKAKPRVPPATVPQAPAARQPPPPPAPQHRRRPPAKAAPAPGRSQMACNRCRAVLFRADCPFQCASCRRHNNSHMQQSTFKNWSCPDCRPWRRYCMVCCRSCTRVIA